MHQKQFIYVRVQPCAYHLLSIFFHPSHQCQCQDTDAVVRLNLYHLDNIGLAFNLVRKTRSPEGAMLVSEYCIKNDDVHGAIEFLLVARRGEDAFALAQTHNEMERYAQLLGDDGTKTDYVAIAVWYEGMRNFARAGHYYAKVEDYQKAMKVGSECS
jgi:WD repeat-containing protein 19